jgi:hypothetical protein
MTSTTPKPWVHDPLEGPRSIRLIEFSQSCPNGPLRLKDVCLDNAPPYHALSYAWGPLSGKTITFRDADGDRFLHVNDCCKDAINAISLAVARSDPILSFTTDIDSHTQVVYLWVDNICIDQAEEAEADFHRQLLLMCEIYSKSMTTIVWLGEDEDDAEYCLDEIVIASPINQRRSSLLDNDSASTSISRRGLRDLERVRIALLVAW